MSAPIPSVAPASAPRGSQKAAASPVTGNRAAAVTSDSTVATPTVRALLRRSAFWVVAGLVVLTVAIGSVLISGSTNLAGRALAGDNPAPAGAMALVQVLREQGVTVTLAGSLRDAEGAMAADSTILLYDEDGYLDADALTKLSRLSDRIVIVDPNFAALQALAPSVGFAGVSPKESLLSNCAIPAAIQAVEVSPGGKTLSLPADRQDDLLTGCFAGDSNTFSLIDVREKSTAHSVSLVPDARLFNNENVADFGNAALALGLLGQTDSLVWYLPTLADVPRTGPPSLAALTPGWVTPVLLLFALVALSAALWRGRRFGPLVAENLPVTVKASETMEGRARLYARSNARLRALDALRVGAVQRLAGAVGLGALAPLEDVIGTVAALTGGSVADIRRVLVGEIPVSDTQLRALSDALHTLEHATSQAVRAGAPPSSATPTSASGEFTTPPAERMDP